LFHVSLRSLCTLAFAAIVALHSLLEVGYTGIRRPENNPGKRKKTKREEKYNQVLIRKRKQRKVKKEEEKNPHPPKNQRQERLERSRPIKISRSNRCDRLQSGR